MKKETVKKEVKQNEEVIEQSRKEIRRINAIESNKRSSLVSGIFITLLVVVLALVSYKPISKNLKYGLDLKGGFEILYQVESIDDTEVTSDIVKNTYTVIEKRINVLGVSEPEISIEGNNIRVQLAGVTDEDEAKATISKMANLTFRNSKDELVMDSSVLKAGGVSVQASETDIGTYYLSIKVADIKTFHEKTEEIRKAGDYLVIWLDFDPETDSYATKCNKGATTNCLSAATISTELTTEDIMLTGKFSKEEATELAELINSGSLPTKLVELSSHTVSPTLGSNSANKTLKAGLIGVIAIMLLLILLYRFSGFITSVSILIYTVLVFSIFELIGGRLTLPGIAAIVIGIGMAVDAAVISFASINNELRSGKKLKEAFKNGNKSSIKAIIDSNITTLIAAIVLYIFGVSSVKGFATMLIISIFVTIFIMVVFNRYLLKLFVESGAFDNHESIFINKAVIKKQRTLNFTKFSKVTLIVVPVTILVIGLVSLFTKGLNLSIDFKGGTNVVINSSEKLDKNTIEDDFDELGYKTESIELIDKYTANIKLKQQFEASDNEVVNAYFEEKYEDASINIGAISNVVKKELIKNALKSLFYACICILLYIAIRFKFSNSVGAIAALVHDSLFVLFVFSIAHLEISTVFIAAILSIIGYSINDTVVVFDKIRENMEKRGRKKINSYEDLTETVNESLTNVLNRCIVTSVTTLLPVISLIIFGSHDILNFNLALLFGLIAGTYSSIFVAVQLWMVLEKKNIGKPNKKKWYEDDKKEVEELKVKGINC